MIVAGVMSGSSLDGLDVAVVSFSGTSAYELLAAQTYDLPTGMQSRLRDSSSLSARHYLELDRDYAHFVALCTTDLLTQNALKITALGLHGHTVVHEPDRGLTTQLCHGGILAGLLQTDVVTDFRIQDVTKGGVGTPLVSIMDSQLLSGFEYYLNLGGIANISYVTTTDITAYDICPCNQLLNYISSSQLGMPYDDCGNIGRQGNLLPHYMNSIDELPYWSLPAPKSLDNGWIKQSIINQLDTNKPVPDILHTLTHWIALKIAAQIQAADCSVLITGGGAYNQFLIETLRSHCDTNTTIQVAEPELLDYKEAILMGYLAYLRLTDQPNVLHSVTNASSNTIAGAHYKGATI